MNLSLMMRKIAGIGTPKQALAAAFSAINDVIFVAHIICSMIHTKRCALRHLIVNSRLRTREASHQTFVAACTLR